MKSTMIARALVVVAMLSLTVSVFAQGRGRGGGRGGAQAPAPNATFESIVDAGAQPENWLTYNGNYASHRHSPLTQITPDNVGDLELKWVYQSRSLEIHEVTPLVANGVMYTIDSPNNVRALDARTGAILWQFNHTPEAGARNCCGRLSRGVAVLDNRVFLATLDAWMIAIDAITGQELWRTQADDYTQGYAFTHAPLVIGDKVIAGTAGGEFGVRGWIAAWDVETGEEVWRFHTVPSPDQPGGDTWSGDSWLHGGAPIWVTGSYDPEANLMYWGTGNPGPDWNGDLRKGDNLYTCSVVALNPDTGKMKWYFQFTPHDVHDWDANQTSILLEGKVKGQQRKLLATANRNAFYYLLDRETGEYLHAVPFAKQTWAKEIDKRGRPVLLPDSEPSAEGTLVFPSLQGATNWFSPAYSRQTGLFYVAVREMGSYYYKTDVEYEPGEFFLGGGEQALQGDDAKGYIKAIDALTGEIKWSFDLHSPPWAGVMASAGGLVFAGTNEGNFFALDAFNGTPLWNFQTGAAIRANPISFGIGNKQYITIASGNAIYVFTTEN
jgi:alcohol dehydrogenase (cytochrome c)